MDTRTVAICCCSLAAALITTLVFTVKPAKSKAHAEKRMSLRVATAANLAAEDSVTARQQLKQEDADVVELYPRPGAEYQAVSDVDHRQLHGGNPVPPRSLSGLLKQSSASQRLLIGRADVRGRDGKYTVALSVPVIPHAEPMDNGHGHSYMSRSWRPAYDTQLQVFNQQGKQVDLLDGFDRADGPLVKQAAPGLDWVELTGFDGTTVLLLEEHGRARIWMMGGHDLYDIAGDGNFVLLADPESYCAALTIGGDAKPAYLELSQFARLDEYAAGEPVRCMADELNDGMFVLSYIDLLASDPAQRNRLTVRHWSQQAWLWNLQDLTQAQRTKRRSGWESYDSARVFHEPEPSN